MAARASRARAERCLVVGYDGSEDSRRAAIWAAAEARGGRLVLVHSGRALHAPALASQQARRDISHALIDELLLDADPELLDAHIEAEHSDEDPVTALVSAAERRGATAIVIGAKRHSRLHRALGVVSGELLERSPVAVIVVPVGVRLPSGARAPRRRARTPRARSGSQAARAPGPARPA